MVVSGGMEMYRGDGQENVISILVVQVIHHLLSLLEDMVMVVITRLITLILELVMLDTLVLVTSSGIIN